jgi:hypothetical protein
MKASTGAHEQTGADRTTDRDHLNLSRTECFSVPQIFLDEDVVCLTRAVFFDRHDTTPAVVGTGA